MKGYRYYASRKKYVILIRIKILGNKLSKVKKWLKIISGTFHTKKIEPRRNCFIIMKERFMR